MHNNKDKESMKNMSKDKFGFNNKKKNKQHQT